MPLTYLRIETIALHNMPMFWSFGFDANDKFTITNSALELVPSVVVEELIANKICPIVQ
jgi:hypothetical protein